MAKIIPKLVFTAKPFIELGFGNQKEAVRQNAWTCHTCAKKVNNHFSSELGAFPSVICEQPGTKNNQIKMIIRMNKTCTLQWSGDIIKVCLPKMFHF